MIHMGLDEDEIKIEHLPGLEDSTHTPPAAQKPDSATLEDHSLKEIMNETEKKIILEALDKTDGSRKEAAKRLGIAVRSLYYKMDKYGID